jgi:hypothetical protein
MPVAVAWIVLSRFHLSFGDRVVSAMCIALAMTVVSFATDGATPPKEVFVWFAAYVAGVSAWLIAVGTNWLLLLPLALWLVVSAKLLVK